MTVDEVYDDALTRCSRMLASNGELDADSQEVAVGTMVEGDDGAFVAMEAGPSAVGEPFVSVRVLDRDGTVIEPTIVALPTCALITA